MTGFLVPGLPFILLCLIAPSFAASFPQDNPPFVSAGSIEDAQRALVSLGHLQAGGYRQGVTDGRTTAAIRDFQSSHRLLVNGVLDQDTMAMLTSHGGLRILARVRQSGTSAPAAPSPGAAGSTSGKGLGGGTSTSAQARASRKMPGTAGPVPLLAGLGGLLAAVGFALWRGHRA
ncbi:MAG: hypothetical protein AUI47_09370 [Acidobacteria bacterium 13_1_40CM_2_68_5]|nr:MAG: hypothetical protein AUI47_09370 [Acidobacteria bacterium 13_1_40CM_2_68_5]